MKKSKVTKVLMIGALLSSSIAPVMVSAKENDTKGEHKATLGLIEGEFTLQTSASLNFGSHTIEKAKKTVSTGFAGDFFVTDARGTQAGWDLTVSATPFTIVKPKNGWVKENPYSLPLGSLTLDTVKTVTGVYNEPASIYPTASRLGVVIDLGQEVNVSNAVKGHGMGKYKFSFGADSLHLVIDPATAKIDKVNYPDTVTPYEATITWNLISGPGTGTGTGSEGDTGSIEKEDGTDNLNTDNDNVKDKPEDKTQDNDDVKDKSQAFNPNSQENISKFDYYYYASEDGMIISGLNDDSDENIIVPSIIDGKQVVGIGQYAFRDSAVETIVLPEGLKFIEARAFSFSYAVEVTIPSTVKGISSGAFMSADNIERIIDKSGLITEKNKTHFYLLMENVIITR